MRQSLAESLAHAHVQSFIEYMTEDMTAISNPETATGTSAATQGGIAQLSSAGLNLDADYAHSLLANRRLRNQGISDAEIAQTRQMTRNRSLGRYGDRTPQQAYNYYQKFDGANMFGQADARMGAGRIPRDLGIKNSMTNYALRLGGRDPEEIQRVFRLGKRNMGL